MVIYHSTCTQSNLNGWTKMLIPSDDIAPKACQDEFTIRHIRRLCIKYFGIPPNLISRIIRNPKTLRFLNVLPAVRMADLAAEQGYFDQFDFIKEFKRFQGVTPIEFIRRLRA